MFLHTTHTKPGWKRVPQPTDLSGLVMWLEGGFGLYDATSGGNPVQDGGAIYRWEDKSGNGNHATQGTTSAQYNWDAANGEVMMNDYSPPATSRYFNTPAIAIDKTTVSAFIIAERLANQKTIANIYWLNGMDSASATTYEFVPYIEVSSEKIRVKSNAGNDASVSGQHFVMSQMSILGVVGNGSNTMFYYDGQNAQSTAMHTSATKLINVAGIPGFASMALGIKDIMLFNVPLTTDAIKQVLLPYAESRGAVINQPSKPVNIHVQGDSITFGYSSTMMKSWARNMRRALRKDLTYSNTAVSGITVATIASRPATYDDPYLVSGAVNVMVIFAGTNDIAGGATGAATEATLSTYCSDRRAAGWKVVVVTALNRNFGATPEAQRIAYNSLINSNWSSYADAIVDLGSDSKMGTTQTAGYFAADNVHPSNLGYAYIAPFITSAVSRLACDG